MNFDHLRRDLIRDEGKRTHPYQCTAGKTTIGVGWNLTDNGLPEHIIAELFEISITQAIEDCNFLYDYFQMLPDHIQEVLINMAFNLGRNRLSKFVKMNQAVKDRDWPEMAAQMLDSKWAAQDVPERAKRLAERVCRV